MAVESTPIGQRYEMLDLLGIGGMGSVYRAYDRLSGQIVALKRVAVAPRPAADTSSLLLALAQEFRLLASLRHPHIISVFDYGFDSARQPYFTMELLDQPQTLLDIGQAQPMAFQIDLLVQALQALTYLHRRGILHHDLKPENMLVSDGQVRLLDFGLSITLDQPHRADISGTLLYLPPEVLDGAPFTAAGDLYAIGVIAYQLLAGHHPFSADNADDFFDKVLAAPPDLIALATPPELAEVVGRLLSKEPGARYPSAEATIVALRQAAGLPSVPESAEIRESFLQAAAFVGREAELAQLRAALGQALAGQGSAWLVGGESGVGKSRLLEELRTEALVAGALVVLGQGVEGGGVPYQLWRQPLRRLALGTGLSDHDAGILKDLVPDIGALLGRAVPDAPMLEGVARRQRLADTIAQLLRRQRQPVLLLLEDLQWADESLDPLHGVLRAADAPLLVLGSYRDDERPDLPTRLPGAQILKLGRLSPEEVAGLSAAMLGAAGRQPQVVALLARETEGNAFFMVEVARVLAEEAGNLSQIGRMTLPMSVFAGGMQAILQRHLSRMPLWARPLLTLAALSGRQLDLLVLQTLDPAGDLERWLAAGNDAAVLEVQDAQWRFAHDKLRGAIMLNVPALERPMQHRRIAEAMETIYPNDGTRAEILLEHWRAAGDPVKELQYILVVTERWIEFAIDYHGAQQLLERGLELSRGMPQAERQQMNVHMQLGKVSFRLGNYPAARNNYEYSLSLAEQLEDNSGRAGSLYGLGRIASREGDYTQSSQWFEGSLQLARNAGDLYQVASVLIMLGVLRSEQADYATARDYYQQSLAMFRALADQPGMTICLINLGSDAQAQGDNQAALTYMSEGLAHAREINARHYIAHALSILALVARQQGDYASALDYISQGLIIDREINERFALANDYITRADIQLDMQNVEAARYDLQQGLQLAQELGAMTEILRAVIGFARLFVRTGQAEQAAEFTGLVDVHSALTLEMRQNDLNQLLAELKAALSPDRLALALKRGRSQDLDPVVKELAGTRL